MCVCVWGSIMRSTNETLCTASCKFCSSKFERTFTSMLCREFNIHIIRNKHAGIDADETHTDTPWTRRVARYIYFSHQCIITRAYHVNHKATDGGSSDYGTAVFDFFFFKCTRCQECSNYYHLQLPDQLSNDSNGQWQISPFASPTTALLAQFSTHIGQNCSPRLPPFSLSVWPTFMRSTIHSFYLITILRQHARLERQIFSEMERTIAPRFRKSEKQTSCTCSLCAHCA